MKRCPECRRVEIDEVAPFLSKPGIKKSVEFCSVYFCEALCALCGY